MGKNQKYSIDFNLEVIGKHKQEKRGENSYRLEPAQDSDREQTHKLHKGMKRAADHEKSTADV